MPKSIYLAGKADQADKKYLDFYCNLSLELFKLGFGVYVPHIECESLDFNSPDINLQIYKRNKLALTSSDIALFYIGQASSGTGSEIVENINNYRCQNIFYYKSGDKPSRQILGFLELRNKKIYEISDLKINGINELIRLIHF